MSYFPPQGQLATIITIAVLAAAGLFATANLWTGTQTFSNLVLNNGQFINGQNEIMAINYSAPATQYVLFNGTTNTLIASGSDPGLVLQKGINAISTARAGLIFIHSGVYTATTQVVVNKTVTIMGANYWLNGGTVWRANTGSNVDAIVIGNQAQTLKGVTIQDMSFYRDHQHSAKHLINMINNTQHSVLERLTFYSQATTMYSELQISGCDADFLSHIAFERDHALAGNETDFAELITIYNYQITMDNMHFVGGGSSATGTYGWEMNKDRGDKMENSEFDLMFKPIWIVNGSPLGNIIFSTTGFFENYNNTIRADPGTTFSGTLENYGTPTFDNFTTNTHYTSLDASNNYTDDTDTTKKMRFIISGVPSKHRMDITIPSANGTVALTNGISQNFTTVDNFTKETFFQPSTTLQAPINLGIGGVDPTTPKQGDIWYNSGAGLLKYRTSSNRVIIDDSQGQTISGIKTFTGGQLVSGAGTFDFRNSPNTLKLGASSLIIRNPSTSQGYTITGSAITANRTLNLPLTTQTETLAIQPQTNFTTGHTAGNSTATASTTQVMLGNYATITPTVTGNIKIEVSGVWDNGITADGCRADVRISTSNMGANGAALAGTLVGTNFKMIGSGTSQNMTFTKIVASTGNAVGTKLFVDLSFNRITGGACAIRNVDWFLQEY